MPSSNPRFQPTCPFIPSIFLLSALAVVYQAIELYPPLLLIFSFCILLIGTNMETKLKRSKGIPSGAYIVPLSIVCVVRLFYDRHTESTWESRFFHFVLSHFVFMWFEQDRFSRLRQKVREEAEKAQSMHDPEKRASQTPEGDPRA